MRTIIVSRHIGLIRWLESKGITGEVIPHVTDPGYITGEIVIGALPLHLAALTRTIGVVDMPRLKPELRGVDLTPEQMDEAGAKLTFYTVSQV